MLKFTLSIFTLLFMSLGGFVFYKYYDAPIISIPLPYTFKTPETPNTEVLDAEVLIIGDETAEKLKRFIPTIQELTGKGLTRPLKIVIWSEEGNGIHRVIHKLQSLKKLPKTIIWQMGVSEFRERKFNKASFDIFLQNYQIYKDPIKQTFIQVAPWTSKFLYQKNNYIEIEQFVDRKDIQDGQTTLLLFELGSKLFEQELEILSNLIEEHKSQLIAITAPINYDIHPLKNCENAEDKEIVDLQAKIKTELDQGQFKLISEDLNKLNSISMANGLTQALNGKYFRLQGEYQQAKDKMKLANAFDCELKRPSIIINAIIKKQLKKKTEFVIDFNEIVNQRYGHDSVFLSTDTPQDLSYQELIEKISEKLKLIFGLK